MTQKNQIEFTIVDTPVPPQEWHPIDCPCCRLPAERPAGLSPNRIALLVLSGLATGEAICFVLDRIIDGPGVLSVFGL